MGGGTLRRDGAPPSPGSLTTLGWREWLALPGIGVGAIRAKIDTGARSSALHVDTFELFARPGQGVETAAAAEEWVRFSLDPDGGSPISCEARVVDRRPVTDSGGHTTERVFISTEVQLAGQAWPIEINLTSRRQLSFPMLLGRSAMTGRFVVDPSASYVLGTPQSSEVGV